MFSVKEKQWLASEIEKLILSLGHPEMPKEMPSFFIHIDGKESWSFADIKPNWTFTPNSPVPTPNMWNEDAREIMSDSDMTPLTIIPDSPKRGDKQWT